MPLRLSLAVSLATAKKDVGVLVQDTPVDTFDVFDLLLTQSGDAIITQNENFLVKTEPTVNFVTQSGDVLITQAGALLEAS